MILCYWQNSRKLDVHEKLVFYSRKFTTVFMALIKAVEVLCI